jgi:hypothetical protein
LRGRVFAPPLVRLGHSVVGVNTAPTDNRRLAPPRFLRNRSGEPGHQGLEAGKEIAGLRSCRPGGFGGRFASLETLSANTATEGQTRRKQWALPPHPTVAAPSDTPPRCMTSGRDCERTGEAVVEAEFKGKGFVAPPLEGLEDSAVGVVAVSTDNRRLAPPRFLRNRSGEPGHQGAGAERETAVLRSNRPGGFGGRVASLETLSANTATEGQTRRKEWAHPPHPTVAAPSTPHPGA